MRQFFWQTGGFLFICVMSVTGYGVPAGHAADLEIINSSEGYGPTSAGLFPPQYFSPGMIIGAPTGDADGDGVNNLMDAFPDDPTEYVDFDGDGVGDNADAFPHNQLWDTDTDGDGVDDRVDNCPYTDNPMQIDENGNAQGDACDLLTLGSIDSENP